MRYTVVWSPVAERELAAIWVNAADREAISRNAYAIDRRLRADPENEGESRPDDRRIIFSKPLGALYRVFPDDRRVKVLFVWTY